MSVKDMIKKSVLESGVFDQYNIPEMLTALIAALLFGVLIYAVYRKFYAGVICICSGLSRPASRREPECMCWHCFRRW